MHAVTDEPQPPQHTAFARPLLAHRMRACAPLLTKPWTNWHVHVQTCVFQMIAPEKYTHIKAVESKVRVIPCMVPARLVLRCTLQLSGGLVSPHDV